MRRDAGGGMAQKSPIESPEIKLRRLLNENSSQSLKKLVSKGCAERSLLSLLWNIPRASNKKTALVTRMTFRDLSKLSEQMTDVANKLARVNASYFLGPSTFAGLAEQYQARTDNLPFPLSVVFTKGADRVFCEMFKSLPARLRLYAEYLEKELPRQKKFDQIARHGFRPQTLAILKLLKLVNDATGNYYYEDVASLLEVAFSANGADRRFDGDGLRKLKKNNPFLNILLYPELLD
jgi:hypothetical protein